MFSTYCMICAYYTYLCCSWSWCSCLVEVWAAIRASPRSAGPGGRTPQRAAPLHCHVPAVPPASGWGTEPPPESSPSSEYDKQPQFHLLLVQLTPILEQKRWPFSSSPFPGWCSRRCLRGWRHSCHLCLPAPPPGCLEVNIPKHHWREETQEGEKKLKSIC